MMNTDSIIFNKFEGWFRLLIYQEFHKIENETLKDARKCSTRYPEIDHVSDSLRLLMTMLKADPGEGIE